MKELNSGFRVSSYHNKETLVFTIDPCLGSPVVPFYPFSFWVPLLKPNSRKKGTLIIKGLLGNLAVVVTQIELLEHQTIDPKPSENP